MFLFYFFYISGWKEKMFYIRSPLLKKGDTHKEEIILRFCRKDD